jgi:glycosyltransferase involved in cell wall biosynthesis
MTESLFTLGKDTRFVVWVDARQPSVQHVPHMLKINGKACVEVLLNELRHCFGPSAQLDLVCQADDAPDLRGIAERHCVTICRIIKGTVQGTLKEYWSVCMDVQNVVFFYANAPVVSSELTNRALECHLQAEADITIPWFECVGLAPAFVMKRPQTDQLGGLPACETIAEFVGAMRMSVQNGFTGCAVQTLTDNLCGPAVPLEMLPRSICANDEMDRRAFEVILSDSAERNATELAHEFMLERIRLRQKMQAVSPVQLGFTADCTILFSSIRTAFAGGEESLFALITNLNTAHFRPVAVFPFESMLSKKLKAAGIPVEVAGWDYTQASKTNLQYCKDLLDRVRPNLIHVDTFINGPLMVVSHLRGIPIVTHVRTVSPGGFPPLADLPDMTIAISETVAKNARGNELPTSKIVTIANPVDCRSLRRLDRDRCALRAELGIPTDARVLCAIGMRPEKRIDVLIEALPLMCRAIPSLYVLLVGETSSGEVSYYTQLFGRIKKSRYSDRIVCCGFTNEISRVYASSDLLVHCNPNEPLGRCMIEAMSFGLPVIGPNSGGASEIVIDGQNGLLYEPGSPASLAGAVVRVETDRILCERLKSGALATPRRFSVEQHVDKIQELYRDLLSR